MKIVLIGFMGSGKTSVAQELAKKFGLEFIDMDEMILKRFGMASINEIFSQKGEQEFRKMEGEVARSLANKENVVISTGGGVVGNEQTMQPLIKDAEVIHLKTGFESAEKRVTQKEVRPPLFEDVAKARQLYETRIPLYEKYADIIIDTDNTSLNEVLAQIEVKLGQDGRE